jgi:predicted transcriptional regulator
MTLQATKLNKSGKNSFAGYTYFELGDFLPTVNEIFANIGLCGIVSYGTDLATLTITDVEDFSYITITSPMADANLKGCHPIQNLGAVETYTRRYLWITALEIVEHDALDAITGKEDKKLPELKSVTIDDLDEESQVFIKDTAMQIMDFVKDGDEKSAFELTVKLDNDEKLALWGLLDSKCRASLKKSASTQQNKGS